MRAAEDKKAEDITVLDLRKAAGFTDYFVICSGTNVRQVRAIADASSRLWPTMAKPAHVEGYDRSGVDPHRLLRLHRARLRARDARCSTVSSGSGAAPSAWTIPPRDLTGAPGRAPPATPSSPSSSRRPARRADDARSPDARSGLRRLLAVDPAARRPALRSLRRSAAVVARHQRADGALRALPPRPPRSSRARWPSAPTTARCARSCTR